MSPRPPKKALLFLGCTVPVRSLNYELSARKVAAALGIEMGDRPDFGCCGFPLKSIDRANATVIAARALAQAGQDRQPLVALCAACAGFLAETAHRLDNDPLGRRTVNQRLAPLGLRYRTGVKVRHFVRFILEEVGLDEIRKRFTRPLAGFAFAPHYGCHFLRPSEVWGGFDDPDDPASLARIIEATGAASLDYPSLKDCCGGGVLGIDESLAGRLAGVKLLDLADRDVTALVLVCPFCNVMYEGQQRSIIRKLDKDFAIPVIYLTQLLGLAMGFSPDDLGFRLNRIKPKGLLRSFAE